jgi:hypothetical protein
MKRMAQGVRADRLADPGAAGDAPHDPPSSVAVEAPTVGTGEDWSVESLADGQVDRSGGAGSERDGDDLAALAKNGQGPVTPLQAEPVDVGSGGLRHSQPVEDEQRDQGMLGRLAQAGGHQQGPHLVAVQPGGMRLIVDARSAHMHGRRVSQQAFLFGVAVEAGDRAEPSGDGGPSSAAALQIAGESLDVSPSDLEQVELMIIAPADELAEVQGVGISGQAAVAGQEPSERQPSRIGKDGIERDDRCRGSRGCQCGTSRVG